METIPEIILYTAAASICIPLGGIIASFEKIRPSWLEHELRHFVIAFGGGVLLAAVSLILVPEGNKYLPDTILSIITLLGGGISFFLIERFLGTKRRERPQLSAMLLDYIPESLALGGAFAVGLQAAPLLAVLIGLQNLPEGFNAFRELLSNTQRSKQQIIRFMFMLVPLGPVLALIGWFYLSEHHAILGAVMLFASGGILYLIFQDIAPQSRMRRHWGPPLGAVLGFGMGMLGTSLTHGF
jgi:ZIP family zinc transporter